MRPTSAMLVLGPVLQVSESGARVCATQAGGALVPASRRPAPQWAAAVNGRASHVGPGAPDKLL